MYHTVWMLHKKKTARLVITLYQHITNKLPTSYRHITNCWPTVGRLSADCRPTGSLCFGENLSAVCRPTDGQQTADSQPTVGRQSANSRPTVGQQTADSWPTVGRQVFWGTLLHNYPFLSKLKLRFVIFCTNLHVTNCIYVNSILIHRVKLHLNDPRN